MDDNNSRNAIKCAARLLLQTALAVGFACDAIAGDSETESESESDVMPPQLLGIGDTRNCFMKLNEPTLSGESVGRVEIVADATIGADGKIVNVEVPSLTSLPLKSWAKSRVLRWATCVANAMQIEPATRDGIPVQSTASIPLKTWTEEAIDQVQPRNLTPAVLASTPEEIDATFRECTPPGLKGAQNVPYQFTVDAEGLAKGVRVLDSRTDRQVNKVGHCVLEKLRFEPYVHDGKVIRQPFH